MNTIKDIENFNEVSKHPIVLEQLEREDKFLEDLEKNTCLVELD